MKSFWRTRPSGPRTETVKTFLRYSSVGPDTGRTVHFPKALPGDSRPSLWLSRGGHLCGQSEPDEVLAPILYAETGRIRRLRQIKRFPPPELFGCPQLRAGRGYVVEFACGSRLKLVALRETPEGFWVRYEFPWEP